MKFSEKLMSLRKSKGWSQDEFAQKLGVTRQTVSKWELDQTAPDMNKLIEMSKLFGISLDELVNDIENANSGNTYKESTVEKNNKKIAIIIFVIGIIIALILCGIGLIKQNNAKNTNEERRQQALEQSQTAINNANARLQEIKGIYYNLKEQYEAKSEERENLNMRDSDWLAKVRKIDRELSEINSQINSLEQERDNLLNDDYVVYYQLVEPISYNIFYYIGAGVFAGMSLIALIYFLVTRRKK